MNERELQDAVVEAARQLGWLVYHTHDSRHSEAGLPDLILVHPTRGRVIVVELKAEGKQPTDAQWTWLRAFANAGVPAFVVRPGGLDRLLAELR
jgi:hypothetical protein